MARALSSAAAPATAEARASLGARALRAVAIPTLSLLVFVALWQALAWLADSPRLMPSAVSVLGRLQSEIASGALFFHLSRTLERVALSFVIAMLVGIAIGFVLGRSRAADSFGGPWLVFFLNLPALVTIVLCYIWIGLVETAAVLAVALNKIPNVAVTVREGARALDPALAEMARVFRVSWSRQFRHIVLPQLLPYIAAAARSGLALIWKIVLVVELLGRPNGVGFQIGLFFEFFDVAGILAYALAFIAVVQAIEWGLLRPAERRINQWRR